MNASTAVRLVTIPTDTLETQVLALKRGMDACWPALKAAEVDFNKYLYDILLLKEAHEWVQVGRLERQYWEKRNKLCARRAEIVIWEDALWRKTLRQEAFA